MRELFAILLALTFLISGCPKKVADLPLSMPIPTYRYIVVWQINADWACFVGTDFCTIDPETKIVTMAVGSIAPDWYSSNLHIVRGTSIQRTPPYVIVDNRIAEKMEVRR